MDAEMIVQQLKNGALTPEEAIEQYEYPGKHISEVRIDNLKVDILDCGFETLNEHMVFKKGRGELIIFGARPSMGKSAFLFQVATHVAASGNVLIYSLEMDQEAIKGRMLAAQTGYSLKRIQRGEVHPSALDASNRELNKLHYYIDDRAALDVRTIRSSAISHHKRHPLSLVVVDYLGLVKSRERNSKTEEVGDVTSELKGLAKDLKCPVLVACQLNRECEKRGKLSGDYRPIMSDLRDSGNIEQDADVIMFLSRQEVYDKTRPKEADLGIAKSRNGETGWFVYTWLGASTRFVDPKGAV